jgi:YD repeat-containing protein
VREAPSAIAHNNPLRRILSLYKGVKPYSASNHVGIRAVALSSLLFSIQGIHSEVFGYDANGRLTIALCASNCQVNYTYDPAGNISVISSTSVRNTNAPVVGILIPSPGSSVTSSRVSLTGTAVGVNSVVLVYFEVNGGVWQNAITSKSWANWAASAALLPGANVITVYAQDAEGNTSTNAVIVTLIPLWTPVSLGTNLILWLDASNSGSVTLDGANVAEWSDRSGQGNNVTNSDASTQPLFQPTGLNNFPCVNFTSCDMGLCGTEDFGVSGNAPRALAAVMDGGLIATGEPFTEGGFGFDITAGGNVWAPYFYNVDVYAYGPAFAATNVVMC